MTRVPAREQVAVVFDLFVVEPVYHAQRDYGGWRVNYETQCGLKCGRSVSFSTTMPLRHARRFARPCARCFPAGC